MNPYLEKIFGPEKAARLHKAYLSDIMDKIDLLFKCLDNKDTKEIRSIAHKLKGSGKSYGLEYISEIGTALSDHAKREDYSGLRKLIQKLENHAQALAKEARVDFPKWSGSSIR
ncbi:MAG: Hpt domain-containing protein [Desulfobacterales bacterium]|nr:Hpt domain-containing protein [Desulfobacterales bacterium]